MITWGQEYNTQDVSVYNNSAGSQVLQERGEVCPPLPPRIIMHRRMRSLARVFGGLRIKNAWEHSLLPCAASAWTAACCGIARFLPSPCNSCSVRVCHFTRICVTSLNQSTVLAPAKVAYGFNSEQQQLGAPWKEPVRNKSILLGIEAIFGWRQSSALV